MADKIDRLVADLTRWSELQLELAGLRWPRDAGRAQPLAAEQGTIDDRLGVRLGVRGDVSVNPLYVSIDEGYLSGGYATPGIPLALFARGVLDLIAARATEDAPVPSLYGPANWSLLLNTYGAAVIAPAMACLEDALGTSRLEHVRLEKQSWPIDSDGEELAGEGEPPLQAAPLGTDEPDWEEIGLSACSADAEHAQEVLRVDIDDDLITPLRALVEARGNAAKRVLLGLSE
jgi:hypothetical protein